MSLGVVGEPLRILIAGCGLVGGALGVRLAGEGHQVWGIRRQGPLPEQVHRLAMDLTRPDSLAALPLPFDLVFYLVSPGERSAGAYRRAYLEGPLRLLDRLAGRPPRRFFFASSTAVYGDAGGAWVDEQTPPAPVTSAAECLLEAERQVLEGPVPATVVRFSGIYGPTRVRLLQRVLAGLEPCSPTADVYTNRIHVEDCAGALQHLARLAEPQSLYLATDHLPVLRSELIRWLALRTQAPGPPQAEASHASERGNKRCSNRRLVASGYRFAFPTYREGYEAILGQLGLG